MPHNSIDIVPQLLSAADHIHDQPAAELEVLLRDAAATIAALREMIMLQNELVLEGVHPIGRA